ncbi:MAG: acetolactate synthase small subunit [Bacteroidetes bacterium HGW-Bacteroidetes-17]|jgi:acetolactate synthase-1/3 small subunit|nr:MAG: acetolactate synthase small subunit [Bacteroidetes bacterium HGW-Bacteroidetes-17]
MIEEFTITVFSENSIGILNRITINFTKRKLNIDSLTVSESAIKGVYKFTIVVKCALATVENLVKQLDKQIDILRTFFLREHEVLHQEMAMYKIETSTFLESNQVEAIIRKHNARILEVTKEYTAIEKTGHKHETQELFEELKPFGVLQFVRSGRVAITRLKKELLSEYLDKLEKREMSEEI